jgi:SAM-dependent methyltransferase
MRLTDKSRWHYGKDLCTIDNLNNIKRRDEWISVARQLIPDSQLKYLELGCAPGQYTAVLVQGRQWNIAGIDYSDDAHLFSDTLSLVGKNAKLYKMDMFNERVHEKFDIVTSFGLVEHFRGASLDTVLELHDSYLENGGYVVIMMPNFTGFNYFWHFIFDRPDLDNHNIDTMQPSALLWFKDHGYEVLFNDYVGVMRLWGNSGYLKYRLVGKLVAGLAVFLSKLALVLDKVGIKLRGRSWSPVLLFVGRKNGKIS